MELLDFIQSETDIKNLNVVLTDLNGIFRGKKKEINNELGSKTNTKRYG